MSIKLIQRSIPLARQPFRIRTVVLKATLTSQPAMKPQKVSEMAKEEGGPSKGSSAAKAQSQMSKEINSG